MTTKQTTKREVRIGYCLDDATKVFWRAYAIEGSERVGSIIDQNTTVGELAAKRNYESLLASFRSDKRFAVKDEGRS